MRPAFAGHAYAWIAHAKDAKDGNPTTFRGGVTWPPLTCPRLSWMGGTFRYRGGIQRAPALSQGDGNRGPHRRGSYHRTHPAPSRIVGSRREGRCRPRPAGTRRAGDRTLARRSIPRLRQRTGVCGKLTIPPAARGAPQTTKWRELESQSPIWQSPHRKNSFHASKSGPKPRRAESDFLSTTCEEGIIF